MMSMRCTALLSLIVVFSFDSAITRAAEPTPEPAVQDFAAANLITDGPPIGVGLHVHATVAHPKIGNTYELYYQVRVHTKPGEFGPLLADKPDSDGKAFLVRQRQCESAPLVFDEQFDVVRGQITGLAKLPLPQPGQPNQDVVLRIEPQIYDVAEKKYLTPAKTPAAMVVAEVAATSVVYQLQSMSHWLVDKSHGGWDPKTTLDLFSTVDAYNAFDNKIPEAFGQVLAEAEATTQTKAMYIAAIPADTLKDLAGYNLLQAIKTLAAGSDAELKSAAQKKLDEIR